MTLLCDVCLELTPEHALVDCADPHTQHCAVCARDCAPCLAAQREDQAVEDAADAALERCE